MLILTTLVILAFLVAACFAFNTALSNVAFEVHFRKHAYRHYVAAKYLISYPNVVIQVY